MKKNYFIWIVFVALAINLLVGATIFSRKHHSWDITAQMDNLMRVCRLVRMGYVDADMVSDEQLMRAAVYGATEALDPFTEYMPPAVAKDFDDSISGVFGGIGVYVSSKSPKEGILIDSVIANTPAFRAGLKSGDMIVGVDGDKVLLIGIPKAIEKLRGEVGTSVTIEVVQAEGEGSDEPVSMTITREQIAIDTIMYPQILPDTEIGYMCITEFTGRTSQDFRTRVSELLDSGAKSLIIDLRNNPGGLVQEAVNMLECFLYPGDKIIKCVGKDGVSVREFVVSEDNVPIIPPDIKVAILIDRYSASASEIMSGCLQEHHRAVIIGERSFGKGSIQNVFPFPDGSSLKMTIAKYQTPNGRFIHGVGIEPDVNMNEIDPDWRAKTTLGNKDKLMDDAVIQAAIQYLNSGKY